MLFLGLPRALWSFTNTNNINSQRKVRCLSAGWSHGTRTIEGVVRLPVTCRTAEQAIFQESEGKREASEERQTRAAGEVSLARLKNAKENK